MKKSILLSTILLTSCATSDFTKTGHYQAPASSENCEYTIYTTQPKAPFEEIGLIEFNSGMFGFPTNLSTVKKMSNADVCKNGGNALLVWEANGVGGYVKATVIHLQKDV